MERRINAISIGSPISDVLKEEARGRVHSVFDRTFNLLIDDRLVGIARKDVYPGPSNVIVDVPPTEDMPALGVEKDMKTHVNDNLLSVGRILEFSLNDAKFWRPKTRVENHVDLEILGKNLELAKRLLSAKAGEEGLEQLSLYIDEIRHGNEPYGELNKVTGKAGPRLTDLVRSIKSSDLIGIGRNAEKLIGLGPGLTPSGDDLLTGLMIALRWMAGSVNGNFEIVRKINETIIDAADSTTLISEQQLIHASRGETNALIQELIEAIFIGSSTDVEVGVERVSKIGETSGADIMVGLFLGLAVGLERID
ncbi:hypothetical protein AKJ38_01825 [candidate division MSBL1 archaeon SCGC-AAA259I14]|uniref:DUF2877 domain-containing protein n=2 Tax=candidate division MSBL1 TaxID=215777 RepID=A0A133USI6_9EURY|nr:hypothetical protein AKJ66_01400 [candidate division MSBL1 archaeon SCGC-AAA259E22]KXA97158.1 hypothetical protein AKJ38_01825 [candidate division MSBL1 archaeon SCGC-AAA259I14]